MASHYSILGTIQVSNKLFLRVLTLAMLVVVTVSSTQTYSVLLNLTDITKRQAYANAIPYGDMKLDAQVVTSLSGLSRGQCIMECLRKVECQALNYKTEDSTCDLLSDYLCSGRSFLIFAKGYRYFDVEKNRQITSMDIAASDTLCRSDAICSPKCTCSRGFKTHYYNMLALPDHQLVPADTHEKCKDLCLAKPLDQCRGVNFKPSTSTCEHLQRIMHESIASFFGDKDWSYYERVCQD